LITYKNKIAIIKYTSKESDDLLEDIADCAILSNSLQSSKVLSRFELLLIYLLSFKATLNHLPILHLLLCLNAVIGNIELLLHLHFLTKHISSKQFTQYLLLRSASLQDILQFIIRRLFSCLRSMTLRKLFINIIFLFAFLQSQHDRAQQLPYNIIILLLGTVEDLVDVIYSTIHK
jgi:hypothetical protein